MAVIGSVLALALAVLTGVLYGAVFHLREPSVPRTVVKALTVTLLAVSVLLADGPPWLVAALALSAVGDAAISRDGEAAFLVGLGSFLVAHVLYVVLFVTTIADWTMDARAWTQCAVLVAVAGLLMTRLWPHLGDMRIPVVYYMVAILAMGGTAALLPASLKLANVGAIAFVASDCVLAIELFLKRQNSLTSQFVWFSYFLAQLLITGAFASAAGLLAPILYQV
ncbi:MAG: lysoplasmalogenase [Pseudomonadota bacterium]